MGDYSILLCTVIKGSRSFDVPQEEGPVSSPSQSLQVAVAVDDMQSSAAHGRLW